MNEGENESVAEVSEIACMRVIGARLRKFLFTETNKISKSASEKILDIVGEYEEQMMKMLCKNERIQGKLDECMRRASRDLAYGGSGMSYASVSAKNVEKSVIEKVQEVYVKTNENEREELCGNSESG